MAVEIGRSTGREGTCKHCGQWIEEIKWNYGLTWNHEDGSIYCKEMPVAEPEE